MNELKKAQLAKSKAHNPTKKKKRKKLEEKTAQQLIKEADRWFSKYIRLRDSSYNGSEWVSECICCQKPLLVIDSEGKWKQGTDNGHFISRGVYSLRYDEFNCNAQSSYCNAWKDKETMQEGYRKGIKDKYGPETLKFLKQQSKAEGSHKRPTKPELLQIIQDSKVHVKYMLEHPDLYEG